MFDEDTIAAAESKIYGTDVVFEQIVKADGFHVWYAAGLNVAVVRSNVGVTLGMVHVHVACAVLPGASAAAALAWAQKEIGAAEETATLKECRRLFSEAETVSMVTVGDTLRRAVIDTMRIDYWPRWVIEKFAPLIETKQGLAYEILMEYLAREPP